MEQSGLGPTGVLARWAATVDAAEIPQPVRQRSAHLLLDTIASALAGRRGDETEQVEGVARDIADGDAATVIGAGRLSRIGAALLNGYQVTAVTVCDVYRPNLCHVTPEIVPPALAAAEGRSVSGRELVTAVTVGLETTTRIGRGINYAAFRGRGWHSPGVIGAFGGAAAAGRIRHLDPDRMRYAFGLAGAQAAGTFAHWGTPTIKFHQAHGSTAGLLAATLAERGFLSSEEILTHPDGGIFSTYSEGANAEAVVARLGEEWELERISMRLWPAASSIQSVVSAIFDLVEAHDLRPADVRRMTVTLSEPTYRMHGEMGFEDKFRALLSTRWAAAVVLHDRAGWLDQFTPERLADPAVRAFAQDRIDVRSDPAMAATGASIEVERISDEPVSVHRAVPKGDADDPLTEGEIVDKFRRAAMGIVAEDRSEEALRMLLAIEELDSVDRLMAALRAT
jgi:aconitate decarboxylase